MITELENCFVAEGIAEVNGFKFTQLKANQYAYLYEVETDASVHYEVFERKLTPIAIDFQKKIFSDTDFKVVYPKSREFGISAWTCLTKEAAYEKFDKVCEIVRNRHSEIETPSTQQIVQKTSVYESSN